MDHPRPHSRRWPPEVIVAALAVILIAGLEALALSRGLNGKMFAGSMVAIGVVIGGVLRGFTRRELIRGPD